MSDTGETASSNVEDDGRSPSNLISLGSVCSRWDYQARRPAETTVVRQVQGTNAAHFRAKLDVDADGAPSAYHPADVSPPDHSTSAFDWLANLSQGDRHGIQGSDEAIGPATGFVISSTTVEDRRFPAKDTRRYVDASSIPYVVIPKASFPVPEGGRIRDGCLLFVVDTKTGGSTGAIFGDVGRAVGEASIRLAQRLGLTPFSTRYWPKVTGFNYRQDAERFFYIVFPQILVPPPWPVDDIESLAWREFQQWGGEDQLRRLVPSMPQLRRAETNFGDGHARPSREWEGEDREPYPRERGDDVPKRMLDPDSPEFDPGAVNGLSARSLSPRDQRNEKIGNANPDVAPDPLKTELAASERARIPVVHVDDPEAIAPRERDAPEDLPGDDRAITRERLPVVSWPASDEDSPCYAHLLPDPGDTAVGETSFEFGAEALELLIAANSFVPAGYGDRIVFALRGARLTEDSAFETVDRIKLADVRPDHRTFRCTLGFYNKHNRKLSAFRGSTVPNVEWMTNYYKKVHDIGNYRDLDANLLPTGCYVYRVEHHRDIYPALCLTDPENFHVDGKATVLRTSNDLTFAMNDFWDPCEPTDDVHCAYSDSAFSSAGCLTIMGANGRGPWGRFQDILKTMPRGARLDVVLLTGREAGIASYLVENRLTGNAALVRKLLTRLRTGSQGEAVDRLQARLGLSPSTYFGWNTKKLLINSQRDALMPTDGIFSPKLDRHLNWGILEPAVHTNASAPNPAASAAAAMPPRRTEFASTTGLARSSEVRPSLEELKQFADPNAKPEYLQVIAQEAGQILLDKGVSSNSMRFCHFMGQIGDECGGFRITHESLYYTTPERICKVWPSRFPTIASARPYLRNEQKLAEKVYFGRLGNIEPGDGYRYRGRGFIQITGRESYRVMGQKIGADLEKNPDLAIEPLIALKVAVQTWADKALPGERDMNRLAELNKLEALTYRINGGYTNLADRKSNFEKAWRLWGQGSPPEGSGEPDVIERGDRGELVAKLKENLTELGYVPGADRAFGSRTYEALRKFQKEHALAVNGIAGPETWAAIKRAIGTRGATRSIPRYERLPTDPATAPRDLKPVIEALRAIRKATTILAVAAVIFAVIYLAGFTQPERLGNFSIWAPLLFAGIAFILASILWHWSTEVWLPRPSDSITANSVPRTSTDRNLPTPDRPEDPEPVRTGVSQVRDD